MTQIEQITAPDGGTFDGDIVLPAGSSGPGILLLPEIFGVDPDVVVSYYGSGIADVLDQLSAITCPTLLHYGTADPYIPRDQSTASPTP